MAARGGVRQSARPGLIAKSSRAYCKKEARLIVGKSLFSFFLLADFLVADFLVADLLIAD